MASAGKHMCNVMIYLHTNRVVVIQTVIFLLLYMQN